MQQLPPPLSRPLPVQHQSLDCLRSPLSPFTQQAFPSRIPSTSGARRCHSKLLVRTTAMQFTAQQCVLPFQPGSTGGIECGCIHGSGYSSRFASPIIGAGRGIKGDRSPFGGRRLCIQRHSWTEMIPKGAGTATRAETYPKPTANRSVLC
ncbi:hypothetical protein FIBSPDRAFT_94976 [Athelia psychrophila]|uniref:Uncharacterized protein n=1 Tax=Athelia psychrophila TaxID=1759441 RepID=A0A166TQ65_9AGAM|nr:hypothetical protein FIBSPDRAFT_94976 [Fibularhizoctonia sp. CBS 109695]